MLGGVGGGGHCLGGGASVVTGVRAASFQLPVRELRESQAESLDCCESTGLKSLTLCYDDGLVLSCIEVELFVLCSGRDLELVAGVARESAQGGQVQGQ